MRTQIVHVYHWFRISGDTQLTLKIDLREFRKEFFEHIGACSSLVSTTIFEDVRTEPTNAIAARMGLNLDLRYILCKQSTLDLWSGRAHIL